MKTEINNLLWQIEERFVELRKKGELTDTKKSKLIGAMVALKTLLRGYDCLYLFDMLKVKLEDE